MRLFVALKKMFTTWLETEGKGNLCIGSAKSIGSKFDDCKTGFIAIAKEKAKKSEVPGEITVHLYTGPASGWERVKVLAWPVVPRYYVDANSCLYRQGTVLNPGSPEIRLFHPGTVEGERELDQLHKALVDVYLDYLAHAAV